MKNFNYELDYSRVKEIRLEKKLTQKNIAEILNIRKETYTQFETMKRDIFPIKKFNELANYFNVSMDYLLKLSNKKQILLNNLQLDSINIGKRLKEIRKENNLYQETLANEIGVTIALISEYENGKRLLSLPFAYVICKKYNISIDWLYGKINEPKYLNTSK